MQIFQVQDLKCKIQIPLIMAKYAIARYYAVLKQVNVFECTVLFYAFILVFHTSEVTLYFECRNE